MGTWPSTLTTFRFGRRFKRRLSRNYVVISGLDSSYDSLIVNLQYNDKITLDQMKERLTQEDFRRNSVREKVNSESVLLCKDKS